MAVTVVLDEDLAGQLQQQADAVQVSVRDFAIHILEDAVQRPSDSQAWKKINTRRLDLIAQEYSQGLSAQEAQELDASLAHEVFPRPIRSTLPPPRRPALRSKRERAWCSHHVCRVRRRQSRQLPHRPSRR